MALFGGQVKFKLECFFYGFLMDNSEFFLCFFSPIIVDEHVLLLFSWSCFSSSLVLLSICHLFGLSSRVRGPLLRRSPSVFIKDGAGSRRWGSPSVIGRIQVGWGHHVSLSELEVICGSPTRLERLNVASPCQPVMRNVETNMSNPPDLILGLAEQHPEEYRCNPHVNIRK